MEIVRSSDLVDVIGELGGYELEVVRFEICGEGGGVWCWWRSSGLGIGLGDGV